ncbi:Cystathionine gamma-synthase [Cryptotrichosporon argae]
MTVVMTQPSIAVGGSVPANTSHAISVSLPTWADNVAYEEGDPRVVDKMETGYPRFFVHRNIQKLAAICLGRFGRPDELAMLFPSPRVAAEARDFLAAQTPSEPSRIVEFVICPSISSLPASSEAIVGAVDVVELQILLFPAASWKTAKAFWQHTGDGISSRRAERALAFLGETPAGVEPCGRPQAAVKSLSSRNRHYARRAPASSSPAPASPIVPETPTTPATPGPDSKLDAEDNLTPDLTTYLEERYGRNLPLFNAPLAKQAVRRRIAGGLLPSDADFGKRDIERAAGPGRKAVTEEDVWLYPTGMSAIWHAHHLARITRLAKGDKEGLSVCFGFPYIDTLKILQKWGAGCRFFGKGDAAELDELEAYLESRDAAAPPVLSLFCEFPTNPLLRSPDLHRLRALADRHGFVIVVDETIGNFINVEVAGLADIVVSSLTKVFSGDSNVMGGSLILNPNGAHYADLKTALVADYEDNYFAEDAVYLERNSRDYRTRIRLINDNTAAVTEWLHARSLADASTPAAGKAIKQVYYPRYSTPENFAACQRTPTLGAGGFGGLFSLTFTSMAASAAFFDALACAKGPSLGTSFTLACPYTIIAHYYELDWAAQYGVEAGLVRISIGQENYETVLQMMRRATEAAEAVAGAEAETQA